MTAFPWNAPKKKPGYATLALASAWDEMWERVNARMEKLREVAVILRKDEDTVAWAVQHMFCDRNGNLLKDKTGALLLDTYTARKIATSLRPCLNIIQVEPFVHFPNAIEVVNCMFITTKEWELIRCMGFGGSDSAIASGIYKYESSSERTLYHSKTTISANSDEDADKAFIFTYGHVHEPQVIATFCQKTGAKVLHSPFLFRHRKYEWMTANIDAILQMPSGKLVVFEAKTTSDQNEDEWRIGPPQQYQRQPLQYMIVLDDDRIERAYIGCLLGNNNAKWYCHAIDRNPAEEQRLIENEERFFNSYILPGIEPDFSGNTDRDLFDYFTYVRPKSAIATAADYQELGMEFSGDFAEWDELNQKRTALKAQLDGVETKMAEISLSVYMGVQEGIKTGYQKINSTEMYSVACGSRKVVKVDTDALRLLAPDVYDKVATETESISAPKISIKKIPKALK